jgi:hypothetical protein
MASINYTLAQAVADRDRLGRLAQRLGDEGTAEPEAGQRLDDGD